MTSCIKCIKCLVWPTILLEFVLIHRFPWSNEDSQNQQEGSLTKLKKKKKNAGTLPMRKYGWGLHTAHFFFSDVPT